MSNRTTITIEFSGEDAQAVSDLTRGVDLNTLLRDALGEFVAARSPADLYVQKRYAGTSMTTTTRSLKIREVEKRLRLAELLKRGDTTIEIEGGE